MIMILYLILEILNPLNLSDNINGWTKIKFENYNSENIFDYMNGAGEVYISYKFNNLFVYNYKKGRDEIILEIFEMKEPKYAYGLFSHLKGNGKETDKIKDIAEFLGDYLIFTKGKYFVSINSKEKISEEKILSFAKEIENKIKNEKVEIEILDYIDKSRFDLKKIKYIFDMNILNYYYYFINQDIFYFKDGTECAFYPLKDSFLVFLLFKDKKSAANALKNLKEKFYYGNLEIKEIEKGKWSGYVLKDKLLKIFLDFKTKEDLIKTIDENR